MNGGIQDERNAPDAILADKVRRARLASAGEKFVLGHVYLTKTRFG